jgi:hypothetical protein
MSVIATIIDITMCIIWVLSVIGSAALMIAIVYILYQEIRNIRGDRDE